MPAANRTRRAISALLLSSAIVLPAVFSVPAQANDDRQAAKQAQKAAQRATQLNQQRAVRFKGITVRSRAPQQPAPEADERRVVVSDPVSGRRVISAGNGETKTRNAPSSAEASSGGQDVVISDPVNGRRTIRMTDAMLSRLGVSSAPEPRPEQQQAASQQQQSQSAPRGISGPPQQDHPAEAVVEAEQSGWTQFAPSSDTRVVYVSASEGNDATAETYEMTNAADRALMGADPMLPQGEIKPFRSIAAARQHIRDGYPDWLLFKRGDVWEDRFEQRWEGVSGRSAQEKILIGAYGDVSQDRPTFLTGADGFFPSFGNQPTRHLALVSLHCEPHLRTPQDGPIGIRILGEKEDLLLEDMYIKGYKDNIVVQANNDTVARDVVIRRSIIVDAWSASGHSQGIFASGLDGLTIEECLFDHNGWNPDVPGAEPTIFNHNMYIQGGCEGVSIERNVSTRASAQAIQSRPAGEIHENIVALSPMGINFGVYANNGPEGTLGNATRNIVFGSPARDMPGSFALNIGTLSSREFAMIRENILIGDPGDGDGMQINGTQGHGVHGFAIESNIVCDFDKCFKIVGEVGDEITDVAVRDNMFQQFDDLVSSELIHFRDGTPEGEFEFAANTYFSTRSEHRWYRVPGVGSLDFSEWIDTANEMRASNAEVDFQDPTRTLESYSASIGGAGTAEDLLAELRLQRRGAWREELTAGTIGDYVREGFVVASRTGLQLLSSGPNNR